MKYYVKDTRGSTSLLAAFLAAALCMLAVAVYSGAMIYSNYQTAQTELERAISISVDTNLINANIRDLVLDIPEEEAVAALGNNLEEAGYRYSEDVWQRIEDSNILFSLKDLQTVIDGDRMTITAIFSMTLPWGAELPRVEIPLQVVSKVLYIE